MIIRQVISSTVFGVLLSMSVGAEQVDIASFSAGNMDDWKPQKFSGETHYRLTPKEGSDSLYVLEAHSSSSASGLMRETKIDLNKTPYLNWTWRVEHLLPGPDERSKAGDDYPARVYVVASGGFAFWNTKSLNYVWANRMKEGAQWPNAYTKQAQMFALQSGPREVGEWKMERRNVREDFKRIFGEDIAFIDAVAIMTDTDQTGGEVRAWYGDMWFSSE